MSRVACASRQRARCAAPPRALAVPRSRGCVRISSGPLVPILLHTISGAPDVRGVPRGERGKEGIPDASQQTERRAEPRVRACHRLRDRARGGRGGCARAAPLRAVVPARRGLPAATPAGGAGWGGAAPRVAGGGGPPQPPGPARRPAEPPAPTPPETA